MNRMRTIRRSLGLTLKQLGDIVGLSEGAISHYETGRRQPDPEMLLSIANALGVSADYLLGNDSQLQSVQPASEDSSTVENRLMHEIMDELRNTPDDMQDNILSYIRFLKSNTKDGASK